MTARLPWRRQPQGGFIAYPNGEDSPEQRATLFWTPKAAHEPEGAPEWHWLVEWEGRFRFADNAYSKQQGADRATEAWWLEIALADRREREERPIRVFINRLLETGLYDLADIDFQNLPQPQLAKLMDDLTAIWRGQKDGGSIYRKQIHEVIKVLSMELFRRRTLPADGRKR
ncbi:MAG TPA: hypothetical protein VL418_10805 [Devosiaceae bacterium]|jgi:hypothetical protein|nr:hypothetical protein [Devosiaceae bacterium]